MAPKPDKTPKPDKKQRKSKNDDTAGEDWNDLNESVVSQTGESNKKKDGKNKTPNQPVQQSTLDKMFRPATEERTDLSTDINSTLKSFEKKLCSTQESIEKTLRSIFTEECLTKKLDALKEELRNQLQAEITKVYSKVGALQETVSDLEKNVHILRNSVSDMELAVDLAKEHNRKISEEHEELKSRLNDTTYALKVRENEINDLEQYTRRNSIRIYGIKDAKPRETVQETTQEIVSLLSNRLQLEIQARDIDISHRLGAFQETGNRPIICKFTSRMVKQQVIKQRRKLKGTSIVIREDLTLKNAKRLEQTSTISNVKNAWSDEGRIFAILDDGSKVNIDFKTDLSKPLVPKTVRRREDFS